MNTEYQLIELMRETIARIEEIYKINSRDENLLTDEVELTINILTHIIRFTENTLKQVRGF